MTPNAPQDFSRYDVPQISRFDACRAFTMVEEGGYSDDHADTGNWYGNQLVGCYAGVTAASLVRCYGPAQHQAITASYMRHLPDPAAAGVYLSYWASMGCGQLGPGLDLMVFDFGFNAGERCSVKLLQSVLGFPIPGDPRTTPDGYVGPVTVGHALSVEPGELLHDLLDAQRLHYASLAQFNRYGTNWLARTRRRFDAALASVPE